MKSLSQEIDIIKKEVESALTTITSESSLEAIRVTFLGRKGKIADLMEQLKNLPLEEKKIVGPQLNQLKTEIQEQLDIIALSLKKQEATQQQSRQKNFDVSAYKFSELKGTAHIYTQIIDDLEDVFISM